jgi:hypothetical protein
LAEMFLVHILYSEGLGWANSLSGNELSGLRCLSSYMEFAARVYRPVLFMAVTGVYFVNPTQHTNTVCEQRTQTWRCQSMQYNYYLVDREFWFSTTLYQLNTVQCHSNFWEIKKHF